MLKRGQVIPQKHPRWDRWHRQYLNEDQVGEENAAPNYPRAIGRLVAGMLQQQPVQIVGDPPDAPLTSGQLADLTDRGVKRACAESVVYLRPALVAGEWHVGILHGGNVEATWKHDRLTHAVVWKVLHPDQPSSQMIVEEYDLEADTEPQVALWDVVKEPSTRQWRLVEQVDISEPQEGEPALWAQLREMQPRRIVPYAFDYEDGSPIPIHYSNEHLVDQLVRLHRGEDDDDSLPRNIISVSSDSLQESERAFDGSQKFGRLRGFRPGKNLLAVPSDQLAQNGPEAFVKQMVLAADLVTREKIERRENQLYEACGIAPASFGRNITGRSDSGAARRADSQTTLVTIAGPARRWAQALTEVVNEVAALRAGSQSVGDRFQVEVREGLKMSQEERAELVRTQRDADASSIQTAVRDIHPDWSEEDVEAEVARIRVDNQIPTAMDLGSLEDPEGF